MQIDNAKAFEDEIYSGNRKKFARQWMRVFCGFATDDDVCDVCRDIIVWIQHMEIFVNLLRCPKSQPSNGFE